MNVDNSPDKSALTSPSLSAEETDKAELKFLLAEYNNLREEVLSRAQVQIQIIYVAIALIAGLVAAVPFLLFSGSPSTSGRVTLPFLVAGLLVVSLVFTSLHWAYLDQEMSIGLIAVYHQTRIRPRVAQLMKQDENMAVILGWERFRFNHLFPGRISRIFVFLLQVVLTASRYVVLAVPAALSLVGSVLVSLQYFNSLDPSRFNAVTWTVMGGFAVGVLYLLASIPAIAHVANIYGSIPRKS